MTVTIVQTSSAAANAPSASANATFPSPVTPGNKLIAMGGNRDAAITASVAGHALALHQHNSGWPCGWIFYRDVVFGDGQNYACSCSSTGRSRIVIIEVAGLVAGPPAATAGITGFLSAAGPLAAPAITSSGFVVGSVGASGTSASLTATNNGFTNIAGNGQCNGSLKPYCSYCYKIATGSQTLSQQYADRGNYYAVAATWAEELGGAKTRGFVVG